MSRPFFMSLNFTVFLLIFAIIMSLAMVGEAKPKPQADAFTSGSILAPWGGNLGGGGWGMSSGYSSASYRYNNGLGFL